MVTGISGILTGVMNHKTRTLLAVLEAGKGGGDTLSLKEVNDKALNLINRRSVNVRSEGQVRPDNEVKPERSGGGEEVQIFLPLVTVPPPAELPTGFGWYHLPLDSRERHNPPLVSDHPVLDRESYQCVVDIVRESHPFPTARKEGIVDFTDWYNATDGNVSLTFLGVVPNKARFSVRGTVDEGSDRRVDLVMPGSRRLSGIQPLPGIRVELIDELVHEIDDLQKQMVPLEGQRSSEAVEAMKALTIQIEERQDALGVLHDLQNVEKEMLHQIFVEGERQPSAELLAEVETLWNELGTLGYDQAARLGEADAHNVSNPTVTVFNTVSARANINGVLIHYVAYDFRQSDGVVSMFQVPNHGGDFAPPGARIGPEVNEVRVVAWGLPEAIDYSQVTSQPWQPRNESTPSVEVTFPYAPTKLPNQSMNGFRLVMPQEVFDKHNGNWESFFKVEPQVEGQRYPGAETFSFKFKGVDEPVEGRYVYAWHWHDQERSVGETRIVDIIDYPEEYAGQMNAVMDDIRAAYVLQDRILAQRIEEVNSLARLAEQATEQGLEGAEALTNLAEISLQQRAIDLEGVEVVVESIEDLDKLINLAKGVGLTNIAKYMEDINFNRALEEAREEGYGIGFELGPKPAELPTSQDLAAELRDAAAQAKAQRELKEAANEEGAENNREDAPEEEEVGTAQ